MRKETKTATVPRHRGYRQPSKTHTTALTKRMGKPRQTQSSMACLRRSLFAISLTLRFGGTTLHLTATSTAQGLGATPSQAYCTFSKHKKKHPSGDKTYVYVHIYGARAYLLLIFPRLSWGQARRRLLRARGCPAQRFSPLLYVADVQFFVPHPVAQTYAII